MASDDLKALLLEDYRHCSAGMAKSEQSGETRINLFIALITLCAGAIGAGYAKGSELKPDQLPILALGVALALFAIGIVTLLRMITRNENTDLTKGQLDLIRQTFKDLFDDSGALSRYDLFPQSGGRKLGGLTDLVATVNSILAASIVVFSFLIAKHGSYYLVAAVSLFAGFISFMAQRKYVHVREKEYKARHALHFPKITEAGGVVHSVENGKDCYVLVRPKNLKGGKDEWVLPQGHIEPQTGSGPRESHGEAALREVYEETGVVAQLRGVIGTESFVKGSKLETVKFYLMEKIAVATAEENRKPRWFSFADALENFEKLNYKESIRILRTAERLRLQAISNSLSPAKLGNQ